MDPATLWPLGLWTLLVAGSLGSFLVLSWLLGERHSERATDDPYESGIPVTGDARARFAPHFYLMAVLFVIFDLEAVFLFAWALVARDAGWLGFAEVGVFSAILLVALAWVWRMGVLDWGPSTKRGG